MFVADEPDLLNPDDEPDAFDALEFVQGGVDLFGEELPPPIPPCDIASDEGIAEDPVVDGEVDPDSVIEAAALADEDDDPDADGSSDADGEVEPVFVARLENLERLSIIFEPSCRIGRKSAYEIMQSLYIFPEIEAAGLSEYLGSRS